jgi:hypothetical protein
LNYKWGDIWHERVFNCQGYWNEKMDSGYESEEIIEAIEEAGYQYVVKAKEYSKPA